MSTAESIEHLPLVQKRRLLGYAIPLFNIPLLVLNVYQTYEHLAGGMNWKSWDFAVDAVGIALSQVLAVLLPQWIPVFPSKYSFTENGLTLTRLLKRTRTVPYRRIERVEVWIREEGKISEEAERYTKESSDRLRKSGLKFVDYTNDEKNIVILLSGKEAIMISPANPRSFLKGLKKRSPKVTAKIVELNARGKTVQELE